jgi:hypothetical protein
MELATRNRPTWRRQILTHNGWLNMGKRLEQRTKRRTIIKNARLPGRSICIMYTPAPSKFGPFGFYRVITVTTF